MSKLENYAHSLEVLQNADFEFAYDNDIHRMGIIGQFNLTFELAWKALQDALRSHGVHAADTGSPREILQLGYQVGFVSDEDRWLSMLGKRNSVVHIYSEELADDLLLLIRDSYIPAFVALEKKLREKTQALTPSRIG